MKTLKQHCKPRQSVYDRNRRNIVLDLTDLIEDRIKPIEFLEENYLNGDLKRLLREAFRRFEGKSSQRVFVLRQVRVAIKRVRVDCTTGDGHGCIGISGRAQERPPWDELNGVIP
jgi:hypothetical protein